MGFWIWFQLMQRKGQMCQILNFEYIFVLISSITAACRKTKTNIWYSKFNMHNWWAVEDINQQLDISEININFHHLRHKMTRYYSLITLVKGGVQPDKQLFVIRLFIGFIGETMLRSQNTTCSLEIALQIRMLLSRLVKYYFLLHTK